MARSRVASFMSHFSGPPRSSTSPSPEQNRPEPHSSSSQHHMNGVSRESPPPPRTRTDRPSSRPTSMIQTYSPPMMEVALDTLPELQPIFSFLNSHSNKLYQEGYFLKLNDLDSYGRPNNDRNWVECFAQLVGTVLSLWDASALDAAGQDGEVVPTFINLTDASIKMIDTLPTRNQAVQPLQNVLSISTAGKNRYLLHFNSHHSLTQWTAGIRLAMYEHATLQEAYTGSLIAGKGRTLNSINVILEKSRFKSEDWARVRFGAGTPWRRCWCVVTPPDEKAIHKQQKMSKKKSAYDRKSPVLRGDIKFYDTKKTKKIQPIATITDAYSAYAIYPQSKPLIDQSTLVKVEGTITIHSKPASTTEGFVFVMPEVHPAVSGFEIMLRWLFPVFDAYSLYGRPTRLIADTLDQRGLMFAMPSERRYGYLEILDVAGLIHTEGSQNWKEAEWRRRMKDLTSKRMTTLNASGGRRNSRGSRRGTRSSLPPTRNGVSFDDARSTRSAQSHQFPLQQNEESFAPPRNTSAPPAHEPFPTPSHNRSISEVQGSDRYRNTSPHRDMPPPPPAHSTPFTSAVSGHSSLNNSSDAVNERSSSDSDTRFHAASGQIKELQPNAAPEPVTAPPAFAHPPGAQPQARPYHHAELRRAKSRISTDTLSQLAGAGGVAVAGAAAAWKMGSETSKPNSYQRDETRRSEDGQRGAYNNKIKDGAFTDHRDAPEAQVTQKGDSSRYDRALPPPPFEYQRDPSPLHQAHTQLDGVAPRNSPIRQEVAELAGRPRSSGQTGWRRSRTPSPKKNSPSIAVGGRTAEKSFEHSTDNLATSNGHIDSSKLSKQTSTVSRKPLPNVAGNGSRPSSKNGSMANYVVDPDALDRVMNRFPTNSSDGERPSLGRRLTDKSSNYDDDSTGFPDYASTRKSTDTKSTHSIEKPRAGIMKTVGTVETAEPEVIVGDARYRPNPPKETISTDIPEVDFGPTLNYATAGNSGRPRTSGTITTGYGKNPVEFEDQTTATDPTRSSFGFRSSSQPPSRILQSSELDHVRSDSVESTNNRRSVAWQPGMGTIGNANSGPRALTPEQYVQHRAMQSRVSQGFVHAKKSSNMRSNTPPLLSRNSAELLNHSRQSSGELTPRPLSRGGSAAYQSSPSGDYSAHLSAREQEHIARVTGSPLLNMGTHGNRLSQGGLVGAIEAREREKQEIKQGISGHIVQQAITQRQQYGQAYNQGQYREQEVFYDANGRQMIPPGSTNPLLSGQSWDAPSIGRRSPGIRGPFVGVVPSPEDFAARRQSTQQSFGSSPNGQYRN